MLTCKKPEQRPAFDTDKRLNVVFHTNMRYKIIFDNLIYFKHDTCKYTA